MTVGIGHEVRVVHAQARDEPQPEGPRRLSGGAHGIGALGETHAGVLHTFRHQGTGLLVGRMAPTHATGDGRVIVEYIAAHADAVHERFDRRIGECGEIGAE